MTVFKHGDVFFGSSTSWANMVVKASYKTYIIHQNHSGLPYQNTWERGIITIQYIYSHKYVVNVNKAINDII